MCVGTSQIGYGVGNPTDRGDGVGNLINSGMGVGNP